MCRRMPAWITPDILTALGVAGAIIIFGGYAAALLSPSWLWLSILGYVIQWFGDSMDGSLARYRQIERPAFGYFIDHSCDGLTTLLIMAGMGSSPYVRLDVALLALIGYLLMSIHAYLSARVLGELQLSYLGAGPTELRFVLIALTLAMLILGPGPSVIASLSGFDLIVGSAGFILILLFIFQTLATARRLAQAEPDA
ncbi:MAG: CDP-alcohol phosphatidyltransferase family protein [Sphingomonas bacterium]|nr:CDP-alcohol phosphatidyltransferase family protein [Sphingomonas bacterium]